MNPKKIIIFLILQSTSMVSIGHDLLSKSLLDTEDASIGYAYDPGTYSDKIFSITKEEIADRIYEKSKEEDREVFIKYFIKYSNKPNTLSFLDNNQTAPSSDVTPLMQQIINDYVGHPDHSMAVIGEETDEDSPPHHGGGELSRSSIEARELAYEKCETFYRDNLLTYGAYGELIPYFLGETDFSEIKTVGYHDDPAPVLGDSHADKDFIIDFTINFNCAFKL